MRSKLLLLFTLAALLFSACASGDDTAETASLDQASVAAEVFAFDGDVEAFEEEAMVDEADVARPEDFEASAAGEDAFAQSGAVDAPIAQQPADFGRDIIYTATLELAATDIAAATTQAVQAVERNGGFLFSQNTQGGRSGSSTLVFKVLPEQFQETLADLGTFGTVRAQSVNAEDVSALVVDLQSRITTNEASVARLRDLLVDADSVEVVARLEGELLERETTLERLRGQLRSVRNQVDLATITVTITELTNRPGIFVDVASFAGHDAGFSCFDAPRATSGEAGDPLTLCYRIGNVGDTPLVDVTIVDELLSGLTPIAVTGSLDSIEVGESAVIAFEIDVEETVRLRSTVTATALDSDGNPLADPASATASPLRLDLIEIVDDTPGFGSVLSGSLRTLAAIALWLALALVAIAPFALIALALFPIGRIAWRWIAKRRPERVEPTIATGDVPPPPASHSSAAETPEPELAKADTAAAE